MPSAVRDTRSIINEETNEKIFNRMDTKILQPHYHIIVERRPNHDHESSTAEILEAPSKGPKPKVFNPYSKSYKKHESAWSDSLIRYESEPYLNTIPEIRTRDRQKEGKKVFKLGVRNDVWESIMKKPESLRSYQSQNCLQNLPDMKVYKKSLEHMLKRNLPAIHQ